MSSTRLYVASTGGHLKELHRIAPRLLPRVDTAVWVTNDGEQSRSLLRGRRVIFVPYQGSRNLRGGVWNAVLASGILARHRPTSVVSTGSGIALSFLPLAAARGASCHYIESGTRVRGPSLTGRLLARTPGIRCYTQHPAWAGQAWRHAGSVLDGFAPAPAPPPPAIRRVMVTLGSWKQGFRTLVETLVSILPEGTQTTWQTGFTAVSDLGIEATPWLTEGELAAGLRAADVVITHAGMGATLDALEAGKRPIVVPRRKDAGEQIDDHQVELADELDRRGLAIARRADELRLDDLWAAATGAVERSIPVPPFQLLFYGE